MAYPSRSVLAWSVEPLSVWCFPVLRFAVFRVVCLKGCLSCRCVLALPCLPALPVLAFVVGTSPRGAGCGSPPSGGRDGQGCRGVLDRNTFSGGVGRRRRVPVETPV